MSTIMPILSAVSVEIYLVKLVEIYSFSLLPVLIDLVNEDYHRNKNTKDADVAF